MVILVIVIVIVILVIVVVTIRRMRVDVGHLANRDPLIELTPSASR